MGAETEILDYLSKHSEGASISDISGATGHTRATAAKYLEVAKLQNKVALREVGKSKLWSLGEKRKRILIAEDENHIRRLVRVILSHEDYDFIEAKDGKEALEKVSEEMPDLVVLDYMMPKIDGVEVCAQLKKNALTRRIPVIMLTAKSEMSDKVVGVKAGADDYLTKPFEPRELRIRVRTFLDREKRERNSITNLPTFNYVLNKVKNSGKDLSIYCIFLKNLEAYKKIYGFSKTNEVIRLTGQIITHNFERSSAKNFAGHDDENNFVVGIESSKSKGILKEISGEFDSTIPFFYDIDYENIDFRNNMITRVGKKGIEKIPIIQLEIKEIKNAADLGEKLKEMRTKND